MPYRFQCPNCPQTLGMDPRDGGVIARCPACAYQFTAPRPGLDGAYRRRERFRQRLGTRVRANRSRQGDAASEISPDLQLAGRVIGGLFGTVLAAGVLTLQSGAVPLLGRASAPSFPVYPGLPLEPLSDLEPPAEPFAAEAPDDKAPPADDAPQAPRGASADEMFNALAIPGNWKPLAEGRTGDKKLVDGRDWDRLADLGSFVELHSQDKRAVRVRRVLVDDARRFLLQTPPAELRLERAYVAAALAAARGLPKSGSGQARETRLFVEQLCRNGRDKTRTAHLQKTEWANAAAVVTMELVDVENAVPLSVSMLLAEVLHAMPPDADRIWLEERFLKEFLLVGSAQLRKRRRSRRIFCDTAIKIAEHMVNDLRGDPERARQLYAVAVHCHAGGEAKTAKRLLDMLYMHMSEGRGRRRVMQKQRCWDLKLAARVRTRIEERIRTRCATEVPAAVKAVSPADVARAMGLQWPVEGASSTLDVVAGKVQKKLAESVRETFPDSMLLALRKRVEKQYRPYAVGDEVTVHLLRGRRMGVVKGIYRGASGSFVRIGSRTISKSDLDEEVWMRFDPTRCETRKRQRLERETATFMHKRNLYRRKHREELAAQFHKEAGYVRRNEQWLNPSVLFQEQLEKTRKRTADNLRRKIQRECYAAESFVWREGAWMPADPDAKATW